jgi:hypothetical protein
VEGGGGVSQVITTQDVLASECGCDDPVSLFLATRGMSAQLHEGAELQVTLCILHSHVPALPVASIMLSVCTIFHGPGGSHVTVDCVNPTAT